MAGSESDQSDTCYLTQRVEEIDDQIFREILENYGQLDRVSFEQKLMETYSGDEESLNKLRHSLYDTAKEVCTDVPNGYLVKRVQRGHAKKSVIEKYASDVFLIYGFITGSVPPNTFQKDVLSKQRTKSTNEGSAEVQEIADTQQDKDVMTLLLSKVIEIHDAFNEHTRSIDKKVEQLHDKFDTDMKQMIRRYEEKSSDLVTAAREVECLRNTELKLRNDIRSVVFQLKQRDTQIKHLKEELKSSVDLLLRKTSDINDKLDNGHTQHKRLYSDVVTRPNIRVTTPMTEDPADVHHEDIQHTRPRYVPDDVHHEDIHQTRPRYVPDDVHHEDIHQTRPRYVPDDVHHEDIQKTRPKYIPASENSEYIEVQASPTSQSVTEHMVAVDNNGTESVPSPERMNNRNVMFSGEWSRAFRGASPRYKTKRLVLSYVKADKPFEVIRDAIIEYAKHREVHVTYVRLLKQWDRPTPTFTLRVNIDSRCADKVLGVDDFWPKRVQCREWVPYNQREHAGAF